MDKEDAAEQEEENKDSVEFWDMASERTKNEASGAIEGFKNGQNIWYSLRHTVYNCGARDQGGNSIAVKIKVIR